MKNRNKIGYFFEIMSLIIIGYIIYFMNIDMFIVMKLGMMQIQIWTILGVIFIMIYSYLIIREVRKK